MSQSGALFDTNLVTSAMEDSWLSVLSTELVEQSEQLLKQRPHGDRQKWELALGALPTINVATTRFNRDAIQCTSDQPVSESQRQLLHACLMQLHPWRKGPFELFGLPIDSEWRSNLKWNRIQQSIAPLKDRIILDVGCGNGYYLYRMLGQGAKLTLGIDPTQLFLAQFASLQHYFCATQAAILPMKSEDFLTGTGVSFLEGFDTVFSMGVYYHRRDPETHLAELMGCLRPGGELVLETLVIEGETDDELEFSGRYAQMRNVWSVPTVSRLRQRLSSAGFVHIELIDLTATSINEQRATDWMRFDSLDKFLCPTDQTRTIEGHPAPLRATLKAQTPLH